VAQEALGQRHAHPKCNQRAACGAVQQFAHRASLQATVVERMDGQVGGEHNVIPAMSEAQKQFTVFVDRKIAAKSANRSQHITPNSHVRP
jgi:hypothetical protein